MSRPMIRSFSSLLFVGLLFGGGCSSDDAATRDDKAPTQSELAQQGPPLFMWEVSREGAPGRVFLLGSVHVQRPDAQLDQRILDVLQESDEVVFEIDLDAVDPRIVQQLTLQHGTYPPGESLADHVSPETLALVGEIAPNLGLPPPFIQRMRPWLLAITAVQLQMQKEGIGREAGVENLVRKAIAASGRPVKASSLETVEFQLSLFASLEPRVQEAMLQDTLRVMKEDPDMFGDLEKLYRAGDAEGLYALVTSASAAEGDQALQRFNKALFDDRNVTMADAAVAFSKKSQTTFICVGAGHLVGPQGVVALMEAQGFKLQRFHALGAPEPAQPAEPPADAPPSKQPNAPADNEVHAL